MPKCKPPDGVPERLLRSLEMIEACRSHDFSTIFRLAKRGGLYPAHIGRCVQLTPSRVTEIIEGKRKVERFEVVERIADGLRIPGRMLGLARRDWELDRQEELLPALRGQNVKWTPAGGAHDDSWLAQMEDEPSDPEFVFGLIESQLPQHYQSANYFGARHTIPSVVEHANTITRHLETAAGSPRQALLRTGSRVVEFLGWLHQDLGDFKSAAYWSDRSMEWAQEAADDHMQAYILFRKSNQATARASGEKAIGLARAAQRVSALTPQLTALAAQQEAQGYALMRNSRMALAKFDEAYALASEHSTGERDTAVDTSYCTPTYIEIQRANCWIDLGQPRRAAELFQDQLAALPAVYRNDRGVYLARLARAHVKAGEREQGVEAATKALAIVAHTGSARTFAELSIVAQAVETQRTMPAVATFFKRFEIAREWFAA